jgi:hypothetical protein
VDLAVDLVSKRSEIRWVGRGGTYYYLITRDSWALV